MLSYFLPITDVPCIVNGEMTNKEVSREMYKEIKTKEPLNNSNIIKNISYDQSEILHNIGMLYNGDSDQFDCDITASTLKFYKSKNQRYKIPEPKILMDVNPVRDDIIKIEKWGPIPIDSDAIHSIIIDLPFVVSPQKVPSAMKRKEGSNIIFNRFSSYYPVDNLYYSYYHWISEAYRVLDEGGILIFKTQSTISGGIRHNIEEFSFMAAQRVGFKMIDSFTLIAKSRLISSGKYKNGQKHSRNYTSKFLVFKKEQKERSKEFNYEELLDVCEEMEQETGYIDIVEK